MTSLNNKKVLSVGCGNEIIPEVDVYLDLYPNNSKERKAKPGNIKIPKNKKFVIGSVENMYMFKNKQFSFVFANHVLEHLDCPEKACAELQRVADAGIIRTPSAFAEIFFGWNYHYWLTIASYNKIYFFSKKSNEHIPFNRFFRERCGKNNKYDNIVIPEIKKVFNENKELFDTIFTWKNKFEYEIIRNR